MRLAPAAILVTALTACRTEAPPSAGASTSPGSPPAADSGPLPRLPSDPEATMASPLHGAEWVGSQACLPCHAEIHAQWDASSHAHTIRVATLEDEDLLASIIPCSEMSVTHALGDRHEVRFLVERPEVAWGKGRFLALPCSWRPREKAPEVHGGDDWETKPFESACAACHVTGFRQDHSFLEPGVGCESCHGPGGRHVASPSKTTILGLGPSPPAGGTAVSAASGAPAIPARDEVTVCASCHLQDAVSRRTGLKFPDGYVPGGSLLEDFRYDWTLLDHAAAEKALDVHQKILVRRIVLDGDDSLRCTSCHSMHGLGHEKHRELPRQAYCDTCHQPDMSLKEYSQQCNVCEF